MYCTFKVEFTPDCWSQTGPLLLTHAFYGALDAAAISSNYEAVSRGPIHLLLTHHGVQTNRAQREGERRGSTVILNDTQGFIVWEIFSSSAFVFVLAPIWQQWLTVQKRPRWERSEVGIEECESKCVTKRKGRHLDGCECHTVSVDITTRQKEESLHLFLLVTKKVPLWYNTIKSETRDR